MGTSRGCLAPLLHLPPSLVERFARQDFTCILIGRAAPCFPGVPKPTPCVAEPPGEHADPAGHVLLLPPGNSALRFGLIVAFMASRRWGGPRAHGRRPSRTAPAGERVRFSS